MRLWFASPLRAESHEFSLAGTTSEKFGKQPGIRAGLSWETGNRTDLLGGPRYGLSVVARAGSAGRAVRREKLDKNPLDLLTRPRRKPRLPRGCPAGKRSRGCSRSRPIHEDGDRRTHGPTGSTRLRVGVQP